MTNGAESKKYIKAAAIIAGAALALFLFFRYLLGWVLPFVIAWAAAFLVQPLVRYVNKKTRIPRKAAAAVILTLLLVIVAALLFILLNRAVYELSSFAKRFVVDEQVLPGYINAFFTWLEGMIEKVPMLADSGFVAGFAAQADEMVTGMIASAASFLASSLPSAAASVIKTLPAALLFAVVLFISLFYFTIDYDGISRFVMIQTPPRTRAFLIDVKDRFAEATFKYLRACLIMALITFLCLLTGFVLIGVDYALTLAAVIAAVDALPVLGAGMVMVPWGLALICFGGGYAQGFSILALFAVIEVARRILEPRIVGKSMGLNPLAALVSVYVGFKALGIAGIFILPICVLVVKNLNDEGKIKLWKS